MTHNELRNGIGYEDTYTGHRTKIDIDWFAVFMFAIISMPVLAALTYTLI